MPGVASAATSVVIAHVAGGTSTIRVGAGGIMLPNHAPLVIAEQFGTLEALFPGSHRPRARARARVRSGDGARAAPRRRSAARRVSARRRRADALLRARASRGRRCARFRARARRADLDSRLEPVRRAARRARSGLPFAFASHFAPAQLDGGDRDLSCAVSPVGALERPQLMLGATVVAADTDEEARAFHVAQQTFVELRRGRPMRGAAPGARISRVCSRRSTARRWRRFCRMRSSGARTRCATS